jgi:hypothetical protein
MVTKEQLQKRRAELLAGLRMTEHELRCAAADYVLSLEEQAILDELDRIDFLCKD